MTDHQPEKLTNSQKIDQLLHLPDGWTHADLLALETVRLFRGDTSFTVYAMHLTDGWTAFVTEEGWPTSPRATQRRIPLADLRAFLDTCDLAADRDHERRRRDMVGKKS